MQTPQSLIQLMHEAADYANAYARQYQITDEATIDAIYVSHLAYLINNPPAPEQPPVEPSERDTWDDPHPAQLGDWILSELAPGQVFSDLHKFHPGTPCPNVFRDKTERS